MFAQCGDCVCAEGPTCFTIARRIGGFAEYSITGTTTNPCTYFVGRRYRTATYEEVWTHTEQDESCPGCATMNDCGYVANCAASYTFSYTSQFSALINIPSTTPSGTNCSGAVTSASFDSSGYYDSWTGSTSHAGSGYPGWGPACGTFGGTDPASATCDSLPEPGSCPTPWPCNSCCNHILSYGPRPNPCAPGNCFDFPTLTPNYSGTGFSYTPNITSTAWSIDWEMDCTKSNDVHCSTCPGSSIPGWEVQVMKWSWVITGALSNEVDYDAIHDSVIAAVSDIASGSVTGSYPCLWGFNDYPIEENNWTIDPSSYDGSLFSGSSPDGYWVPPGVDSVYGGTGLPGSVPNPMASCFDGGSCGGGLSCPSFQTVPFAATWYQIGTVDTPGVDPWDTWIASLSAKVPVTNPYIVVTYIWMSDGSFVLDTYGTGSPCQDGTGTGSVRIPQPSAKNLPAALYTTSGGTLIGPIGRVNVIIEGVTCGTWDGTMPT